MRTPAAVGRIAIGALGIVVVAGTILAAVAVYPRLTFFAGATPLALLLTGAGLALLVSGLVVLRLRPAWRSGPLLVLAAVLWFGPVWVASDGAPLIVRSLGMVAPLLTPVALAWVIVGFPDGRSRMPGRGRALVVLASSVAIAVGVFALFYDPFEDVWCWATCGGSAFLVVSLPWLAGIALIAALVLDVLVLGFATVCALRDASVRRGLPWVLAAAAASALVLAAVLEVVTAAAAGPQGPGNAWAETAQAANALGVLTLACAIATQLWLVRRRQHAIDDIVRTTAGMRTDSIEEALRRAVGDRTLSLAYWLPESERFVNGDRRAWEPPGPSAGMEVVTIMRGGRIVAAIAHSERAEIDRHLGPALRVAIENEALRVELDVQLTELQAARTRIVIAHDERRRELERALHDGAQHRMTVLVLQLRSLADIAEAGSLTCAADLQRGIVLARSAIDELRELAHGVYPAILESGGLRSALATYATGAPIAVELDAIAAERAGRAVEMTAYRLVVTAVADAARRLASHAVVDVAREGGTLTVAVADDAGEAPAVLSGILDRVGAVGGTVRAMPHRIVGEMPCES